MVYFLLSNAAYLKYFLPIVQVLNTKGEKSCFYMLDGIRYSSPHHHIMHINSLANKFGFDFTYRVNWDNINGTLISVEGLSGLKLGSRIQKISLTALTDFTVLYNRYIRSVDHVILPSRFFAEHYKTLSDKNLYFGSPKYDVEFKEDEVKSKYQITKEKNALILFPRSRDLHVFDMAGLYSCLHKMGYNIIVKTRGKDIVNKALRGDRYYEDFTWFPHTTMELMTVCDFVVNFDSTAVKECVMMDAPFINFHIKPFERPLDFLYNYKYCVNFDSLYTVKQLEDAINYLTLTNLDDEFGLSRKNHLFEKGDVARKIVDFIMEKNEYI